MINMCQNFPAAFGGSKLFILYMSADLIPVIVPRFCKGPTTFISSSETFLKIVFQLKKPPKPFFPRTYRSEIYTPLAIYVYI